MLVTNMSIFKVKEVVTMSVYHSNMKHCTLLKVTTRVSGNCYNTLKDFHTLVIHDKVH